MSTVKLILASLISLHVALLTYCAYTASPTTNEPGQLVAGISYWRLQQFDLSKTNPPLVPMVATLPVLGIVNDPQWRAVSNTHRLKTQTYVGRDFISAYGERSFGLLMLCRFACIPFSLLGCLVCFLWGRDLYGATAGLLSATLWCFDPNILAHGSLITSDVAGAALGVSASYMLWRWLRTPTWKHAILAGVVLGLAELAKTTLIVLYPLWPVLWIGDRLFDRKRMRIADWRREGVMLCVLLVTGIYVLNLGYGCEGSMTELRRYTFHSQFLTGKSTEEPGNRFHDSWIGGVPVPLPMNYLLGIDEQHCDFEDYDRPSYLAGKWQQKGWWYYYLYAVALKVPLGSLCLILCAASGGAFKSSRRIVFRDELIVMLPAIVIFTVVSLHSGFSEHLRYVLPAFPLLFIWTGRSLRYLAEWKPAAASSDPHSTRMQWATGAVIAALVCWSIGSNLSVYPHCLAYFNEAAGGPKGGHFHLLGSNLDWGQDLRYVKAFVDERPGNDIFYFAYEGAVYPEDLGIAYSVPTTAPDRNSVDNLPPGLYAVSVTFLRGMICLNRIKGDSAATHRVRYLNGLLDREPIALCGYSVYVYHIP